MPVGVAGTDVIGPSLKDPGASTVDVTTDHKTLPTTL